MDNNSRLAMEAVSLREDEPVDVSPTLKEREGELTQIVDALESVASSKAWSTLKTKVFDDLVKAIEKELRNEAKNTTPDALKLNRLAGQLKWAEKYADLSLLATTFRDELTRVRHMLHGKDE